MLDRENIVTEQLCVKQASALIDCKHIECVVEELDSLDVGRKLEEWPLKDPLELAYMNLKTYIKVIKQSISKIILSVKISLGVFEELTIFGIGSSADGPD